MANHEREAKREVYWRDVLQRHALSGLTIGAFCQREQFTKSAFYAWRRTIAERDAEVKPVQRPAFLPEVVEGDSPRDGGIRIELAGGHSSPVADGTTSTHNAISPASWPKSARHPPTSSISSCLMSGNVTIPPNPCQANNSLAVGPVTTCRSRNRHLQ